jgi:tRNA/rRNA methyltransferase
VSFWAYMLRCADDSFYVGHTDDLDFRIEQHQSGLIPGYTQKRRPLTLVWSEEFPEQDQAFDAERQIKGWSRLKKQALIDGNRAAVSRLAKKAMVLRDEPSPGSVSPQDERFGGGQKPPISAPVIVLVRPQLGQNIGKAARAMLNFGLTELRLVAPRDGWPNPDAGPAASGADIVLERARVYDSIAEATADCAHVYATTVRRRGVSKPVVTPQQAAAAIRSEPGRSAFLFGPERSGLETDDVAIARTIVTVPINPEFGSLNLAQAVILIAYEWSKGETLASPPEIALEPAAPQEELDGLIGHLERLLEETGYFFPPDRAPTTKRTLRGLLTKPGWNSQEVRTLRGVLSTIERPRSR